MPICTAWLGLWCDLLVFLWCWILVLEPCKVVPARWMPEASFPNKAPFLSSDLCDLDTDDRWGKGLLLTLPVMSNVVSFSNGSRTPFVGVPLFRETHICLLWPCFAGAVCPLPRARDSSALAPDCAFGKTNPATEMLGFINWSTPSLTRTAVLARSAANTRPSPLMRMMVIKSSNL